MTDVRYFIDGWLALRGIIRQLSIEVMQQASK
jgi:hypothetical protein